MEPLRHRATYEDLLALPENVKAEVIDGEVHTAPSPLPEHSWAAGALNRFVGGPFGHDHGRGGPGGWWILAEVDVQLTPHDIVRPDLSGWRRDRLPEPWGQRPVMVVPDWICEVISPSSVAYDRVTKSNLYAEQGIAWFWLVDPVARVLEAFQLTDGAWLQLGSYDEHAQVRIPPFDAVELDIRVLFPPR